MPKLHILSVFSANADWLFHIIVSNVKKLPNVALAPLDTPAGYNLQSFRFWSRADKMAEGFEEIKAQLAAGKDVVLMSSNSDPLCFEQLAQALQKSGIAEMANIDSTFVIGKPAVMFEYFSRHQVGKTDKTSIAKALDTLKNMPRAFVIAQKNWANIKVIPDSGELRNPNTALEVAKDIFGHWRYEVEPFLPSALMLPNFMSSATGLRIVAACRLRDNDWPRLNEEEFMSRLLPLDGQWSPEFSAPLAHREKYAAELEKIAKNLEVIVNLPADCLAAPEWFLQQEALFCQRPLREARINEFSHVLKPDIQVALIKRWENDSLYLTDDSALLRNAISNKRDSLKLQIIESRPILTVLTLTCNQEKYIAECMDSVQAQQTNFPIQHIVLDHYSRDKTPDIVNDYASRYPNIRPVLLKGSQNRNNVWDIFDRCRTKYAALCDGDDYFLVPDKLQKQVDYLEAHPNCSLVFHPVLLTFEDGRDTLVFPPREEVPRRKNNELYLLDLVRTNIIQTNSVVYRWRFTEGLPKWFRTDITPGDWYWHLLHAEKGKAAFIPEVMSVYRRHARALYSNSMDDNREHNRKNGLNELKAYDAYNEHFRGRFFQQFATLANGIFMDLLLIGELEGDSTLLDRASNMYPEFFIHFVETMKKEVIGGENLLSQ